MPPEPRFPNTRLGKLRERYGVNQEVMAKGLGVTKSHYQKLESGRAKIMGTLLILVRALEKQELPKIG